MKTKIIFIVLFLIANLYSQFREIKSISFLSQGDCEVNIGTSLGVGFARSTISNQNTSIYNSSDNEYSNNSEETHLNFILTSSVGYFIIDGLQFEPELNINIIPNFNMSITLLGNILYNFNFSGKRAFPYIKAGYGFSNLNSNLFEDSENLLNAKLFNAGIGLKYFYSSETAIRIEINYKNISFQTYI